MKSTHPTLFAHAVPPASVNIRRKARFGEAFEAIAHNCLTQIRHNVAGVQAGDSESLHQMRVGVRRLRALLDGTSSLGVLPEDTRQKLRWLGQELGKVRNWDVFLDKTLPSLDGPHVTPQALQEIEAAARTMAAEQRAHIPNILEGENYRSLMNELALWDGERLWCETGRRGTWGKDARKAAKELMRKSRQQVEKRVRKLNKRRPERLHRLRIAVKKERYMREFFASLTTGAAHRRSHARLEVLSDAQEKLGALNDSRIACELLQSLRERFPANAASLAFLEGLLTAKQDPAMLAARRFARRKLAA